MKRDAEYLLEAPAPAADAAPSEAARDGSARPAPPSLDGRMLRRLMNALGDPPLRVTLWNGESIHTGAAPAVATVRIGDRATLLKLCINPELHLGDAYRDGAVEIEGDMVKLFEAAFRGLARPSFLSWTRRLDKWFNRPRANTLRDARENIHHHYDLGNEFYRLWLDRDMLYTCAYFPAVDATLEQAQAAKMEQICRKLRLRQGECVVEAGCGWGALALYMATHHGVRVRAFNISREQIAWARARARAAGAEGLVEFIEDDYRNISGRYDAFVSVGMLEHVGVDHYNELGAIIDRSLGADGRGFLHSIGQIQPTPFNAWIEKRIFPGAYPPALGEMLTILDGGKFSVLDIENLRQHYALTIDHWLRRFENAREQISAMYDERFARAWRFYLAGSQAAFNTGNLQLFQVLFARGSACNVPWTRAFLYAS